MIKPPGKPGPSIFLAKQPKRTPTYTIFFLVTWNQTLRGPAEHVPFKGRDPNLRLHVIGGRATKLGCELCEVTNF